MVCPRPGVLWQVGLCHSEPERSVVEESGLESDAAPMCGQIPGTPNAMNRVWEPTPRGPFDFAQGRLFGLGRNDNAGRASADSPDVVCLRGIGASGLEPPTSCTPCKRASQTAPRPEQHPYCNTVRPSQQVFFAEIASGGMTDVCHPQKRRLSLRVVKPLRSTWTEESQPHAWGATPKRSLSVPAPTVARRWKRHAQTSLSVAPDPSVP